MPKQVASTHALTCDGRTATKSPPIHRSPVPRDHSPDADPCRTTLVRFPPPRQPLTGPPSHGAPCGLGSIRTNEFSRVRRTRAPHTPDHQGSAATPPAERKLHETLPTGDPAKLSLQRQTSRCLWNEVMSLPPKKPNRMLLCLPVG